MTREFRATIDPFTVRVSPLSSAELEDLDYERNRAPEGSLAALSRQLGTLLTAHDQVFIGDQRISGVDPRLMVGMVVESSRLPEAGETYLELAFPLDRKPLIELTTSLQRALRNYRDEHNIPHFEAFLPEPAELARRPIQEPNPNYPPDTLAGALDRFGGVLVVTKVAGCLFSPPYDGIGLDLVTRGVEGLQTGYAAKGEEAGTARVELVVNAGVAQAIRLKLNTDYLHVPTY